MAVHEITGELYVVDESVRLQNGVSGTVNWYVPLAA
jgi:hypothetical protein